MSISALSSTTTGSPGARVVAASNTGFGAQVSVALGLGRTVHGHRTQETGAPVGPAQAGAVGTPASAASLAADTRSLVGDVFGALGADTPSQAAAQQATAAYRRAG